MVAGGAASASDVGSSANGAATGVTRVAPSTLTSAGTDVVLQAQHDLTISSTIEAAGSVRAQAGNDITVNARVASRDGDLDFRAGNAFILNARGTLATGNYIDIAANSVTLAGSIVKGTGAQLPILTFTSSDPSRAIVVGAGTADAGTLWLDAATLGRLSTNLYEINLGNSRHTGPVQIRANLTASSSLVMENAGTIAVDARVDLTANPESRAYASLYGGADGRIQVSGALSASKAVTLDGAAARSRSARARACPPAAGRSASPAPRPRRRPARYRTAARRRPPRPPRHPDAAGHGADAGQLHHHPGRAGCAALIAKEIQACTIAPNGANCGRCCRSWRPASWTPPPRAAA